MADCSTLIASNVARVRDRIAKAAVAAGRTANSVTLLAVTKYVGLPEVRALLAAGCTDLGESRPQALWEKASGDDDLSEVRWHMIGHLQRNKVARTLPLVASIQSVDSPRLLAAIDAAATQSGRRTPVLLEVNTSGEATKHGLSPDQAEALVPNLGDYPHVEVRGLMTIAAREGGPDVTRRNFAALRQLCARLRDQCPKGIDLRELSMGMSGDFEVAIAEGATIVRVGSTLFEGVLKQR
jgi:pyridoxal phosphate enzyme (YggS family)